MIHFEYPDDIDEELIPLLNTLNNITGVSTQYSCCGHHRRKNDFYIFLHCSSLISLRRIFNAFDYSISTEKISDYSSYKIKNKNSFYKIELGKITGTPDNAIGVRISNDVFNYLNEKERKIEYEILIDNLEIGLSTDE